MKGNRQVVTTDAEKPVVITDRIAVAKLKSLARQQHKSPSKYLQDLIDYYYTYY